MSRSRKRTDYSGMTLPEPIERGIRAMRITVTDKAKAEHIIDMTHVPVTPLSQAVVEAMALYVAQRRVTRVSMVVTHRRMGRFLAVMAERGQRSVAAELTPDDIDAWVADCRSRLGKTWYEEAREVIGVMRRLGVARFARDTWTRISRRVSLTHKKPRHTIREAYDAKVADALEAACRKDMDAVIKRLTETGPKLLAEGRDPRGGGREAWTCRANLVWAANELGPLSKIEWLGVMGVADSVYRSWYEHSECPTPRSACRELYPMTTDLLPFYTLFLLKSGTPPAPSITLKTDALKNTANRRFSLTYVKHRAKAKKLHARHKDGNLGTPGGIIRAVLQVTERLRGCHPSEMLWWVMPSSVAQARRGAAVASLADPIAGYEDVMSTMSRDAFEAFVKRHGLKDVDGEPLRIEPARLRKTYKAAESRRTHGALDSLTRDHTASVHMDRYAKVRVLVPIHRQIVYEAMQGDRTVTTRTVLLDAQEAEAARAEPEELAARTGQPLENVELALRTKDLDMWLAKCFNPMASPYAPKGVLCPGAPLGWCLDCPNGMVSPDKLPAIFGWLDHVIGQRRLMDGDTWRAVHGKAYEKIVLGILPHYSDDVLREAKLLAVAHQGPLIYIGPGLRPWGHL